MLRAIVAIATTVVVLGAPAGMLAQETDQARARMHFSAGTSYYEAGDYADALREFERSYALSRHPDLLYNIAICHEHLGDLEPAVRFLERYLADAPDVENRPSMELRLGHMRERLAAQQTEAEQAEAAARARAERDRAAPQSPPSAEPNVGAIASFSVAALGVVGAGIFAPLAFVEDASLASGCGATRACTDADLGTLRAFTITTDVSLSVALAAATLGTVLVFVGGSGDAGSSDRAAVYVVPFAAPGTAGLALGGDL